MAEIYDKHFDEAYAALTVSYCFGIPFYDIDFQDKPDLQITSMDLGIEVTQAISQYEGMCRAMSNRYSDSGYSPECMKHGFKQEVKNRYKHRKLKGKFGKKRRLAYMSLHQEPYDLMARFQIMQRRILHDKLPKLNKEYTLFANNALYLFTYMSLINGTELQSFFDTIAQEILAYPQTFDAYYINCIDHIYLYNCQSRQLSKKPLLHKQLPDIKKAALELAQKNRERKKAEL